MPPRLLNEGEEVLVDVRPHWWYLARPVTSVVVVLAGAVAAYVRGTPVIVDWLLLAVLVAALGWLLGRYARWASTSLVVTSERIVQRRGVVARTSREIPVDSLSDIGCRQTLFGRIIGAGDLVLESAGRDSEEIFSDIPHPSVVQAHIYRQLATRRRPPAPGMSVPEQIDKLDELRRRGVITAAEFEAKKTQLLDRM